MISFGNAASSPSGLIPLKTAFKNFALFKKLLYKFFINFPIQRSIINKYTLQVSRTLKTGKASK